MAAVKWSAVTSRGTVLTTQLNSIATGGYTALGSAYDNTSNLDRWGWVQLNLASLNPTAGACIYVYIVPSFDGGTEYDQGPSSTNPGTHLLVATLSITTGSGTKLAISQVPFALPPGHFKFAVRNVTGVTLAASGNTLELFTSNEAVG